MKRTALVIFLLVLLCTGCVEQKSSQNKTASQAGSSHVDALSAAIISPKPGEILTGDKDVSFEASVKGGKKPYTYTWTSNLDGILSTKQSFNQKPSDLNKGEHNLILQVTDSSGNSTQSSVLFRVM